MNPMPDFSRATDWKRDPKHVLFVLARYKFVAKMLACMNGVLEVGAGDGVASELVRNEVGSLVCTDAHPGAEGVIRHDILERPYGIGFKAVYALDVIEHVHSVDTDRFLGNLRLCLAEKGLCIIGSPSRESQVYASEMSRAHHVNCMSAQELRTRMLAHFRPVLMFGMNDEVLHTGFDGMRHYNFAVGVR